MQKNLLPGFTSIFVFHLLYFDIETKKNEMVYLHFNWIFIGQWLVSPFSGYCISHLSNRWSFEYGYGSIVFFFFLGFTYFILWRSIINQFPSFCRCCRLCVVCVLGFTSIALIIVWFYSSYCIVMKSYWLIRRWIEFIQKHKGSSRCIHIYTHWIYAAIELNYSKDISAGCCNLWRMKRSDRIEGIIVNR